MTQKIWEKRERTMATCNVNKRDSKKLRNRNGDVNLVARFRRTRKGQKLVVNGTAWGVEGRNGSDYYEIRIGSDGVLYCNCPDYNFRGHKSNHSNPGTNYMCKHVRAYLVHAVKMISNGISMDSEVIIYNEVITNAAIESIGREAAAGNKVAGRKAA